MTDVPADRRTTRRSNDWVWAFAAGTVAGAAAFSLMRALRAPRGLDRRLIHALSHDAPTPPTVVVPGIMGSSLLRPDGTRVWLDLRNAVGWHDLHLEPCIPPQSAGDDLLPGPVVGTDPLLPRLFGFTEYADLDELLRCAGLHRADERDVGPRTYLFASYDWRLDLLRSVRRLHEQLEDLAQRRGDPTARFDVIAHSMGGLVARYYLRYGAADVGGPVTWSGARRIRRLLLVATPNAGSVGALHAILNGERVGLSYGTLSARVVAHMPPIYQLLPPPGARPLLDEAGQPLDADLHDVATWKRFGWGPFAPQRRRNDVAKRGEAERLAAFVEAALARARAVHRALSQAADTACPARVALLGGDCLPTLTRAIVPARRGAEPRFTPDTAAQAEAMVEAGDGTVARSSLLASHLPSARTGSLGCGLPEVEEVLLGAADHHGIYREPALQSHLLRFLMQGRAMAHRPRQPWRLP